jgi:hypothetical protein
MTSSAASGALNASSGAANLVEGGRVPGADELALGKIDEAAERPDGVEAAWGLTEVCTDGVGTDGPGALEALDGSRATPWARLAATTPLASPTLAHLATTASVSALAGPPAPKAPALAATPSVVALKPNADNVRDMLRNEGFSAAPARTRRARSSSCSRPKDSSFIASLLRTWLAPESAQAVLQNPPERA